MAEQRRYVRVRGKVMGPFGIEQMESLRNRKQLCRFHEVSIDKIAWSPASSVPGLFPEENAEPNDTQPRELVLDENTEANGAYLADPIVDTEPVNSGPAINTKIASLIWAITITASIAMLIGLVVLICIVNAKQPPHGTPFPR